MKIQKTFPAFHPKVSANLSEGFLKVEYSKYFSFLISLSTLLKMKQDGILSLDCVDFDRWKKLCIESAYGSSILRLKRDIVNVLTENTPLEWDSDFHDIYWIDSSDEFSLKDFQNEVLKNLLKLESNIYSEKNYTYHENFIISNIEENELNIYCNNENNIVINDSKSLAITLMDADDLKNEIEQFISEYFENTMIYLENDKYSSKTNHIPLFEKEKEDIMKFCSIDSPVSSDVKIFLLNFFKEDEIDASLISDLDNIKTV